MAGTDACVCVEPSRDTERALQALDVSEMKLETDEFKVSAAEEQVIQQNPVSGEKSGYNNCYSFSVCCLNPIKKVLESEQQPKAYCRSSARLMSHGYSVNMILHSTRNLLEDYCLMSQCRKSLYCSKVQCAPTVVACNNCGKQFMGRGDRVLKLCIHIECKHRKMAGTLVLDMIRRYSALLERMRKFLRLDQHLIAAHFD